MEDEWKEYMFVCVKEKKDELMYECLDCDYVIRRERDLKKYFEIYNVVKDKFDEFKDLRNNYGDFFDLIGLKELSIRFSIFKKKKDYLLQFFFFKKVFRMDFLSVILFVNDSEKKKDVFIQIEYFELCECGIQMM